MCKIGLVILFFLLAGECRAQNYFVLIDAGNRQPFYVRIDSQFHSSSAEGHIILSRLRDGLCEITIGFPGQTIAEQRFEFGIHGKDQAFELRDHGGDVPGLFDLQTNEWLTTRSKANGQDEFRSTGVKKDDAFSRMMAGVVHDTAVLYNTYTMEQTLNDSPVAVTKTPTAQVSALALAQDTPSATAQVTPPVTVPPVTPPAAIPVKSSDPDTIVAKIDTATEMVTTHAVAVDTALKAPTTSAVAAPDTTTQLYRPVIHPAAVDTGTLYRPVTHSAVADTRTQLYRPITHPPVADTVAEIYRPPAGSAAHKAAPTLVSPGKTVSKMPLLRPVGHVTKISERRMSRSFRLVYADHSQGKKTDTIVVIIPIDTPHSGVTHSHGPNVGADSLVLGQNTVFRPLAEAGSSSSDKPQPDSTADTQRRPAKGAIAYVNSDCHNFATDLDVDKLRAKMLEALRDDDRIAVARKAFKVKCFYTRYIRALSEIFTTDVAKYHFFEAAWPFAADEHFHELSNLLADPVYSGKFSVLTGQP